MAASSQCRPNLVEGRCEKFWVTGGFEYVLRRGYRVLQGLLYVLGPQLQGQHNSRGLYTHCKEISVIAGGMSKNPQYRE